jgi:hypothetical protein
MIRKLGNGVGTKFWRHHWAGARSLCQEFLRLFSVSTQQQEVIRDMGNWVNHEWIWNFHWRRNLFQWELDLVAQLEGLISGILILPIEDSWSCATGEEGEYTVKAGYSFLSSNFLPEMAISDNVSRVLKSQWLSMAPLKVIVFSWQLLLQRLPTRVNLSQRGVLGNVVNPCCVWCPEERETGAHIWDM